MQTKEAKGHLHPISRAIFDIRSIFEELGFAIAIGPELETEWYNFDALNIPKDHPARDMQDTFWIKNPERKAQSTEHKNQTKHNAQNTNGERSERQVLRTHTSPVQIRYMEEKLKAGVKPPYKIIVPGKVFRNEATDATHEAQFFQLEGLYVDKNVSMAHLKGVLEFFFKKFFGPEVEIRFRPSFFSFTEPSAEVDMFLPSPPARGEKRILGASQDLERSSSNAKGVQLRYGGDKRGGGRWLEMVGSGLVHPNVLKTAGVPEGYSGFAFGCGIDRLVMVKYGIPDIRLFYNGDLRLVNQF